MGDLLKQFGSLFGMGAYMRGAGMNVSTETRNVDETSLTKTVVDLVRYYLGGRRGLMLLTVTALGAGLFLNWGWLVAAGIAPLLLALAPCAAMCALGLCMHKKGGKECSTQPGPAGEEPKD